MSSEGIKLTPIGIFNSYWVLNDDKFAFALRIPCYGNSVKYLIELF